jgi:hypothetical protein
VNPPPNPAPAAFMEGLVPSLGNLILTNETVIGNAILAGGFSRAAFAGGGTGGVDGGPGYSYEVAGIRSALSFTNPMGGAPPPNSSLTSQVTNGMGEVVQLTYLRAASKNGGFATAFSPDGGDAGLEDGAMNYRTDSVNAMVEGVTQLWYGFPNMIPCAD